MSEEVKKKSIKCWVITGVSVLVLLLGALGVSSNITNAVKEVADIVIETVETEIGSVDSTLIEVEAAE